jgi:hypothetical protein
MTTAQARARILRARRRQAHRKLIRAAYVSSALAAAAQPSSYDRSARPTH